MAEPMTEIVAGGQSILERGHVPRAEAVDRARRFWQRQSDKANEALTALGRGDERVYHQRGVYSVTRRTELRPTGPAWRDETRREPEQDTR